ncbi:MAG TPA: RNA polymerase sigma-54 factor, partial [Terricaulis sp.]|nr:RNA polymerase sigma-54 factor [Terricaulis sp.]
MAMTPRLELRQGQALVMTPQLQQAIKLLQLSNVELQEFVEGELERNPLLEREESSAEAKPAESGDAQALEFESGMAPAEAALDVSVADMAPDLSANELAEAGAAPLTDWSKASSGKSFDDLPGIEETLASDLTLAEHLDAQLTEAGLTAIERMIGGVLIDAADDWGYMRADLREIADRIGAPFEDVERVLKVMQGFEPTGVMARDIPECLTLQLKERDRFDPAMEKLIANLDLLARGHMDRLMTICGVDREDLADMIAEVRALTPKPGAG